MKDSEKPKQQIDFNNPLTSLIAEVIREVEQEPWYWAWQLSIWQMPSSRPHKGKLSPTRMTYDAHYEALFEVASRIYARAIRDKEEGKVVQSRPLSPLEKLMRDTLPAKANPSNMTVN